MRALILGSGPAAAAVAMRLAAEPGHQITVVDIGEQLDVGKHEALGRLAATDHWRWAPEDLATVLGQPVAAARGELPQKRTYGSDHPFRDVGQLSGISGADGANLSSVSGGYGGFSSVWGTQIMPYSRSTFTGWPIGWSDMEPHYRAVLREVPLAADEDDLQPWFPLLADSHSLPPLATRSADVLTRYARHRAALRRQGVLVGRARLALRAQECVRCGLCMTGCPYSLPWSAAQTFDRLRRDRKLDYRPGWLAYRVGQRDGEVFAEVRPVTGAGGRREFVADRLFVACGGMGTTRIVLNSMFDPPDVLEMSDSVQFVVPFLSARPKEDPRARHRRDFTLNQFNILIELDDDGDAYDVSQIHCYPYSRSFADALPTVLKHRSAAYPTTQVLRRLTVGLGYLPSWLSPKVRVRRAPTVSPEELPPIHVSSDAAAPPAAYHAVLRRLTRVAPRLDLWPLVPAARLSGPAKSYHFGGSFPHAGPASGHGLSTDRLGRLPEWSRIHLVDGSVFPTAASTTFTLTVMANAHRIASEVASHDIG